MEIELNSSRTLRSVGNGSIAPQRAVQAGQAPELRSTTADLQTALNNVPLVRPEKVALAKAQVAQEKYPPNDLLDRIAVLLAMKLK